MTPEAILRLDGMEIHTTDVVCVRTLWGLMSTAITPKDALALNGRDPVPVSDDAP